MKAVKDIKIKKMMIDKLNTFNRKKFDLSKNDNSSRRKDGKLTAIERVNKLFDPGTFIEIGALALQDHAHRDIKPGFTPRDGIVTGYGLVNGRSVGVGAYDIKVKGGSMGFVGEWKLTRVKRLCAEQGFPLVILCEGAGARLEEEISSRAGYDNPQFENLCKLSGQVPIIVGILGECFGGHANISALGDFVPMTSDSVMGLVGPPLLKSKLNIDITKEELGGVDIHCEKSGMADLKVKDDYECIDKIKEFLDYLPSNCEKRSPIVKNDDDPERRDDSLLEIVSTNTRRSYDMNNIIKIVVDKGQYFELKPEYAKNIIICLARMNGRTVGIVANQPKYLAGTIDVDACKKIARFVNMCDAFGIALIFFQDVPGFLPGPESELKGIIKWSTRLLYELAHTTVPRITVLIRKAYGLAHYGMCNLGFRPNLIVTWPTGEFSAIDPVDAVDIMFGKKLNKEKDKEAEREMLIDKFKEQIRIDSALEASYIDDVIDPRDTRSIIIKALKSAKNRRSGNGKKIRGITPI